MKSILKTIRPMLAAIVTAALALVAAAPAFAQLTTSTGTVATIETNKDSLNFRVYLTGVSTMCTGGGAYAYTTPSITASNWTVGQLMAAKTLGLSVTIYSQNVGGGCLIYDVVTP